jgi:ATP-binding protein involved in chromosome partitioning
VIDPRPGAVAARLAGVRNIIPISGGKGGVGKSVISACLALTLREAGRTVGLLDLDFTSPTIHVLLGMEEGTFPKEDRGILPPEVHGIRFMTMAYYCGSRPAPLRGDDFTNAMIELLAITRWEEMDYLIVDMPPGITDAALDAIRLLKDARTVLVATPSRLACETLRRLTKLLQEIPVGIVGVVENMARRQDPLVRREAAAMGVPFLGSIGFEDGLEEALGDPRRLLKTDVAASIFKHFGEGPAA